MGSRPSKKLSAAIGIAALMLVGSSLPSGADHGIDNAFKNPGQPDCRQGSPRWDICRADNATHTWFLAGGYSSNFFNAAVSSMNDWGTTDINTVRETTLSYLETDVHFWQDSALAGTNTLANTDCLVAVDWLRCGAYQIRVRPDVYQGTYNLAKAVVCHETGHTLGLLHGADSNPQVSNQSTALGCMRTAPLTGDMRFIGDHNIWEANRIY
jgi:hypothetical protein